VIEVPPGALALALAVVLGAVELPAAALTTPAPPMVKATVLPVTPADHCLPKAIPYRTVSVSEALLQDGLVTLHVGSDVPAGGETVAVLLTVCALADAAANTNQPTTTPREIRRSSAVILELGNTQNYPQ
jgi:hypothetical protein